MLNELYALMEKGHSVIILIIPYDEHDHRNQTLRRRLEEEVHLTRAFYSAYLGIEEPRLRIISAYELSLDERRVQKIQEHYANLYETGSVAITQLINEHNRPWASPNITFVAKCIAAIELLSPQYLACGDKHSLIAESFDALLKRCGANIPTVSFGSFLDLFMQQPMDMTDGVHSFIEVTDNPDLVLHKLFSVKDEKTKAQWLDHFFECIFNKAPERFKHTGFDSVRRTISEREHALNEFLTKVRKAVPYATNSEGPNSKIDWRDILVGKYTEEQRSRIERIARSAYSGRNCARLEIDRSFNSGQSGSAVLGVREFRKPDSGMSDSVSILKVGPHEAMRNERQNFEKYIQPRKTFAFMDVVAQSGPVDDLSGLVYQEAHHYLGLPNNESLDTVASLLSPSANTKILSRRLQTLFSNHLFQVLYRHGTKCEAGTLGRYYNEFLPAEHQVTIDRYEAPNKFVFSERTNSVWSTFSSEVTITEVHTQAKRARAYSIGTHTKIDLLFTGAGAHLIDQAVRLIGCRVYVEGMITRSRAEFFADLVKELGAKTLEKEIELENRMRVPQPSVIIEQILGMEFRNFQISPVHGDLHSGNVLVGGDNYGIIDYGSMRAEFPSLYDVAHLLADINIKAIACSHSLHEIATIEKTMLRNRFIQAIVGKFNPGCKLRKALEYRSMPENIKSLGDSRLFHACLSLAYIGMTKFNLTAHQKRACLTLMKFSFNRI